MSASRHKPFSINHLLLHIHDSSPLPIANACSAFKCPVGSGPAAFAVKLPGSAERLLEIHQGGTLDWSDISQGWRRAGSCALLVLVSSCSGSDGGTGLPSNRAPVFQAPPNNAFHNRQYTAQIVVTDPDGDPITLEVRVLPGWLSFDLATRTLSGTPDWDNIDSFVVNIVASDGKDSTSLLFTIVATVGPNDCGEAFGDLGDSPYILPFDVGRVSLLSIGYCRTSVSHVGYYAFDFDLPVGDTIRAARAGVVIFERDNQPDSTGVSGQENLIYIQHEDGTVARYVHMLQGGVFVSASDEVQQGQAIALNGVSGATSPDRPHLHFDVFHDTRWNTIPFATGRWFSMPINFSNAQGPLNALNGLIQGEYYTALEFAPVGGG